MEHCHKTVLISFVATMRTRLMILAVAVLTLITSCENSSSQSLRIGEAVEYGLRDPNRLVTWRLRSSGLSEIDAEVLLLRDGAEVLLAEAAWQPNTHSMLDGDLAFLAISGATFGIDGEMQYSVVFDGVGGTTYSMNKPINLTIARSAAWSVAKNVTARSGSDHMIFGALYPAAHAGESTFLGSTLEELADEAKTRGGYAVCVRLTAK